MLCLLLGAGVTRRGMACDTTGTASVFSVFTAGTLENERVLNLKHVVPGWITFGILDSGGGSFKWFKDNFAHREQQKATKEDSNPYTLLCEEALDIPPGSEGLYFLPYLQGERTLGKLSSRGVFFGISSKHTKSHFIRAVLEGITFDLKQTAEIIENSGIELQEIRTIGGGAQSDFWSQLKADIYRKPVVTLKSFEGGIVGASLLAGAGVGLYENPKVAAEEILEVEHVFHPSDKVEETYQKCFRKFKLLHNNMQRLFD